MTWDNYRPDVRDALKDNQAIRECVKNIYKSGGDKEEAIKRSGAPYEVVDRIFKMLDDERGRPSRRDSTRDPDGNE